MAFTEDPDSYGGYGASEGEGGYTGYGSPAASGFQADRNRGSPEGRGETVFGGKALLQKGLLDQGGYGTDDQPYTVTISGLTKAGVPSMGREDKVVGPMVSTRPGGTGQAEYLSERQERAIGKSRQVSESRVQTMPDDYMGKGFLTEEREGESLFGTAKRKVGQAAEGIGRSISTGIEQAKRDVGSIITTGGFAPQGLHFGQDPPVFSPAPFGTRASDYLGRKHKTLDQSFLGRDPERNMSLADTASLAFSAARLDPIGIGMTMAGIHRKENMQPSDRSIDTSKRFSYGKPEEYGISQKISPPSEPHTGPDRPIEKRKETTTIPGAVLGNTTSALLPTSKTYVPTNRSIRRGRVHTRGRGL
jgi:hypothetical protein